MSVLDRFRRRNQQSVLPDEVRQYYQSEQRQRRGVAVLFALAALVITLLIGAVLFFGGRAVYNSVTKDNTENKPAQNQGQTSSTSTNKPNAETGKGNSSQQDTATKPSTNTPQPAPTTTTPAPAVTPRTGDNTSLPRTGDEGM